LRAAHTPLPLERPAVFFCLALAAGLIVGERLPANLPASLLTVLGGGLIFRIYRRRLPAQFLAAAGVFLVLGYMSLQPWVAPLWPADHIKHLADGPRGTITGRIVGLPQRYGSRTRFLLAVERFNQREARGNLRVSAVGRMPTIHSGARVQFRARVKSIRNFNNPGAFDYRRYLMFQGVWASAWVPADTIQFLDQVRPLPLKARLDRVRAAISTWIGTTLANREGALVAALVTGDRSGITTSLRQQFNRLGIGHLLAISGLHIGIIATVSFGLFYWVGRRIPWLVRTGRARQAAALGTLAPVLAYGLMAGLSPATQRAVIMVAVFLFAIVLDRQSDPVNTLAAAALIIMVLHPPALFSVSFQLSFSAVFTIVYGLTCLPEPWLRQEAGTQSLRPAARLRAVVTTFFWVSLLAILGTLPLAMHYFSQVSCIGLFANFIYIPTVGFVTVPLALAATVLLPVSDLLAGGLLKAAGFVLSRALELADYLNRISWIAADTVTLNWFEVVCLYSLLVLLLQLIKSGRRIPPMDALPRAGYFVRVGLVVVGILLAGDAVYWLHHRFWHRDLRVSCIDVRQGSAALVEFPGGTTMLVDGGGYTDNSIFDIGAQVVAPFLRARKILTVDILVLSHPNSDHLNGLLYIAEHFQVSRIWSNGEAAPTAGYRQLMRIVQARDIEHPAYPNLPVEVHYGGATVTRLYPPPDFHRRVQTETWRRSNNNSIVLRVALDGVAFLFAGDLMRPAETELVRLAGTRLQSSVLFVPHHGSKSSSSAEFIAAVQPAAAVVSAGRGNRYRFPAKVVLGRYHAAGCRVYRTDHHGAITLTTRGGRLEVETYVRTVD
jgi:competence protein ComEC